MYYITTYKFLVVLLYTAYTESISVIEYALFHFKITSHGGCIHYELKLEYKQNIYSTIHSMGQLYIIINKRVAYYIVRVVYEMHVLFIMFVV